ncbi:MAG: FliM/FliN family flagellar motor C-terminal domain-containing protein [Candidatus Acidiferrum sp.]|jgi:flagellar motor switch protein FliN/FliY
MATQQALQKEFSVAFPEELWEEANFLPCVLSVDLKVMTFTVRDLLRLETGVVLETESDNSADVPVVVNSQRIGWAEFEVIGQKLGIRITELG